MACNLLIQLPDLSSVQLKEADRESETFSDEKMPPCSLFSLIKADMMNFLLSPLHSSQPDWNNSAKS
ncbi:hypothetical protein AMECASPLE_020522 [Ameca splendens]|uniref:Uncharacterized protein n=1 Tax=Ameca splendens TaxID=208324 RepID=A0ABV1A9N6_9TELE